MYDESQLEQAINAVYDFAGKLRSTVDILKSDADSCIVNMEDDVVARNASLQFISVMDRITEILDNDVNKLLADLQEELETAERIAQEDD